METVFVGRFKSDTKNKSLNVNVEGDYFGSLLAIYLLTKNLKEQKSPFFINDSLTQVFLRVMSNGLDDFEDICDTECSLELEIMYDEVKGDVQTKGKMNVNYKQLVVILEILFEQVLNELKVVHGENSLPEFLKDFEGVCEGLEA